MWKKQPQHCWPLGHSTNKGKAPQKGNKKPKYNLSKGMNKKGKGKAP